MKQKVLHDEIAQGMYNACKLLKTKLEKVKNWDGDDCIGVKLYEQDFTSFLALVIGSYKFHKYDTIRIVDWLKESDYEEIDDSKYSKRKLYSWPTYQWDDWYLDMD